MAHVQRTDSGALIAIFQQSIVLREDETEMEAIADKPSKDLSAIPEAEVVKTPAAKPKPKTKKPSSNAKKRRKK